MDGRRWWIADVIIGLLSGLFSILGIITGMKAASYNEEQQFKNLEKRYGLTPIETEEETK